MGNIKMGLSGEGYKRLRDQSKDKPELMDKYFAYQNEHNDPNLERFF